MGLAIAAIIKGYKCVFTSTDKQSKEKFDALRALGAEVIVCPTDVEPEDPRSYYSVSSRLTKEIPNTWKPNQYDNLSNSQAHYESTGPEIWAQTKGKITHLVVGVGTGGTITGTSKFLKEQNANVQVYGIDTYGSIYKKMHETGEFDKNEIYPYITEGIGEDFLPQNVDYSKIDYFEKVTDKQGAIYTRKIAREEGIFVGNSAGSAIAGILQMRDKFKKGDVVVVIFHDHGTRYLGKMFNDDWMREKGFLTTEGLDVKDLVNANFINSVSTIECSISVKACAKILIDNDFSQMPVTKDGRIVGTIKDEVVFEHLQKNPKSTANIESIMSEALPFVDISTKVSDLALSLNNQRTAILVKDFTMGETFIVTRTDLLKTMV